MYYTTVSGGAKAISVLSGMLAWVTVWLWDKGWDIWLGYWDIRGPVSSLTTASVPGWPVGSENDHLHNLFVVDFGKEKGIQVCIVARCICQNLPSKNLYV